MNKIKYILLFLITSYLLVSDVNYNNIKPHDIKVKNLTEFVEASYMSFLLSYYVFEIDTLDLIICYLPLSGEGELEFSGIVTPLPFGTHRYLLLLNKNLGVVELRETLSHEFIHINQHETGRLVSLGNIFIWEGDTINVNEVEYRDRPFEIEAYNNQDEIFEQLNKIYP